MFLSPSVHAYFLPGISLPLGYPSAMSCHFLLILDYVSLVGMIKKKGLSGHQPETCSFPDISWEKCSQS